MNYPCAPEAADGTTGPTADRLQAGGSVLITSHCHLAKLPHLLGEEGEDGV